MIRTIFVQRFFDVLLSVYLFNEKRGYLYLEQLADAFATKYPKDTAMLMAIRKHAADERHHHALFAAYFQNRATTHFELGIWYGYCDQMVAWTFGRSIDQLDPKNVVEDDKIFFQLCRLIMITEKRGMKQVRLILENRFVRRSKELTEIFSVVQRDEPSHCYPYQTWLKKHDQHQPSFREHATDAFVHYSLMLVKLPLLFCNPFLRRASTASFG